MIFKNVSRNFFSAISSSLLSPFLPLSHTTLFPSFLMNQKKTTGVIAIEGRTGTSAVPTTSCFCRSLGFGSQHQDNSSHLFLKLSVMRWFLLSFRSTAHMRCTNRKADKILRCNCISCLYSIFCPLPF